VTNFAPGKIRKFEVKLETKSYETLVPEGTKVSIRKQVLNNFGEEPYGANQHNRTPEITSRRSQVIRLPDYVQGAEEITPLELSRCTSHNKFR
jgi:hypothetical protein